MCLPWPKLSTSSCPFAMSFRQVCLVQPPPSFHAMLPWASPSVPSWPACAPMPLSLIYFALRFLHFLCLFWICVHLASISLTSMSLSPLWGGRSFFIILPFGFHHSMDHFVLLVAIFLSMVFLFYQRVKALGSVTFILHIIAFTFSGLIQIWINASRLCIDPSVFLVFPPSNSLS